MTNTYLLEAFEKFKERNPNQREFHQSVLEVLSSLDVVFNKIPELKNNNLIERLLEPERTITFRVPFVNDKNEVEIYRGYRIQFNSAIGPFKGGLRFHPSVNLGIMNFLAFEQIFKNALTGLPIGGAKGGANFNPRGKSNNEIMRFCQSFMTELSKYIGQFTDIPAGDIGVGEREIGYLYGQYKKLKNENSGVLTGKGLTYGGSLVRREATGYGLCYFAEKMLEEVGESFKNKKIIVSGSGNVAIYAAKKANELGARVIAMSDSDGYIYDEEGIDLSILIKIKEFDKSRISEYLSYRSSAKYQEKSKLIWSVPSNIALPCATQNELDVESARELVKNGCILVAEGANMPCTPDAIQIFLENKILFGPAKAANAGGVAVSALEMAQNSSRCNWSFEEVDLKLKNIMTGIYKKVNNSATEYGFTGNYMIGSNIAGFLKIAKAMNDQGIV